MDRAEARKVAARAIAFAENGKGDQAIARLVSARGCEHFGLEFNIAAMHVYSLLGNQRMKQAAYRNVRAVLPPPPSTTLRKEAIARHLRKIGESAAVAGDIEARYIAAIRAYEQSYF